MENQISIDSSAPAQYLELDRLVDAILRDPDAAYEKLEKLLEASPFYGLNIL